MAMTDFTFEYFVDYDNFKMARFDTDEYGIPVFEESPDIIFVGTEE